LEVGPATAHLRALAHPLRLRLLSLLTAGPASAAELARETGGAHANISYHLRTLDAAGLVELDSETSVRGGRQRRYRVTDIQRPPGEVGPATDNAWPAALAAELRRRWPEQVADQPRTTADAELWVDPEVWTQVVEHVRTAMLLLHSAAQPPRTPGTLRTSTTAALFGMRP
jgi:DNA-binding transcriptional ArsR family regulator